MRPGISVVIPTLGDRIEYLIEALECVADQTKPADEVIVVFNGVNFPEFTRRLGEVCEMVDETVQLVRGIPNGGAPQARNYGVLLARCAHIAFLDDDDLWEPDYLQKMGRHLGSSGPDLLVSRLDQLTSQGEVRPCKQLPFEVTKEDFLAFNPGTTCSALLVSRESFLEVGGFSPDLPASHDKAFVLEMVLQGKRIEVVPEAQSIIREHPGSRISTSRSRLLGTERFVQRYRHLMSPRHRLVNGLKLARLRFCQNRNPWSLLKFLCLSLVVYACGLQRSAAS